VGDLSDLFKPRKPALPYADHLITLRSTTMSQAPELHLAYTIFYVQSVPETLAFYERAFGFKRKFLHEAGDWGELDTGSTRLSFCSHQLLEQSGKTPGHPSKDKPCFEIALTTLQVAAAVDHAVANGARLIQTPEEMPWGQTVAYVADPNGFLIEICTPVQ
jgi:lactoylglutathione lyase